MEFIYQYCAVQAEQIRRELPEHNQTYPCPYGEPASRVKGLYQQHFNGGNERGVVIEKYSYKISAFYQRYFVGSLWKHWNTGL